MRGIRIVCSILVLLGVGTHFVHVFTYPTFWSTWRWEWVKISSHSTEISSIQRSQSRRWWWISYGWSNNVYWKFSRLLKHISSSSTSNLISTIHSRQIWNRRSWSCFFSWWIFADFWLILILWKRGAIFTFNFWRQRWPEATFRCKWFL